MSQVSSTTALSAFEAEVIEVFVGLSKVLGLPKSHGEIYGLLFASAQPLSFADIQEKLDLSKGSVSQGLRALRELGAVRLATAIDGGGEAAAAAVKEKRSEIRNQMADGRRPTADDGQTADVGPEHPPSALRPLTSGLGRDRYVPEVELRRLVSALLQASIAPQLTRNRKNLARAIEVLPAEALPDAQRTLLFQRLEKLQTWHNRAKGLLPWAVRMLG